jgi:type II secretory pathway pseudopilin PulG
MYQPPKNIKGETILETIIALSILAIGLTLASTVIAYSLRNINASKNRVIAINIAREGIEAMRNIRDTNWMKFSGNRRVCWNHNPDFTTCDGTEPIAPGNYIIYKEETDSKWLLDPIGGTPTPIPDPPSPDDTYVDSETTYIFQDDQWIDYRTLYHVDIDAAVDTDNNGFPTDDADIYNHIYTTDTALGSNLAKRTVFRRWLKVEYIENDGDIITPAEWAGYPERTLLNRMRITANVNR